jgi:GT2 family glycosyltransferase
LNLRRYSFSSPATVNRRALKYMLSIVIPTHQRCDLLKACLASLAQHAPRSAEVIVVDDASPGGYASDVAGRFDRVRIVRRQKRGGFAAAINSGIRASTGGVIEVLNDDTQVTAGWADAALAWFDDLSVGAVAPLVLTWPDGTHIDSAGDRYYLGGVAAKRGHGQRPGPEFDRPCAVFGASASSGFYRRAALQHAGLFAESFGSYFEDVDLAFRLQRAGYRTMFEPSSRILHRGGASHGRGSRRLLEQQSGNEERVFWRNVPDLLGALPRHLAVLITKAYRRWQEGTLAPWLCGRLRLLGEVRELLRHRQALRESYAAPDMKSWHVETSYWG